MKAIEVQNGAIFSECKFWRYVLTRRWKIGSNLFCTILLNPSTADEVENDPTVYRCIQRAKTLGFDGLIVLNAFALRSTDPKKLYQIDDEKLVIGPDNDEYIMEYSKLASKVMIGWGNHGKLFNRGYDLVTKLIDNGIDTLYALGFTLENQPKHPLYLSYQEPLREYIKRTE